MTTLRYMLQRSTWMALVAVVALSGCRGTLSENAPIHINPNMDWQESFKPQEANDFFADGRAARPPVAGTVARGFLKDDVAFFEGRDDAGVYVATSPVPVTPELLQRGQERYNIYCSMCHGDAGDGAGIIMTGNNGQGYGYVPAPTYHSDNLRAESDGYLYEVIANGVRNMPGYAQQITVADRWAIVSYVRALQRSQYAPEADVPASELAQAQQNASANIN
ncbi:MAG: cytochrome c [Rhodothermales bacterium]